MEDEGLQQVQRVKQSEGGNKQVRVQDLVNAAEQRMGFYEVQVRIFHRGAFHLHHERVHDFRCDPRGGEIRASEFMDLACLDAEIARQHRAQELRLVAPVPVVVAESPGGRGCDAGVSGEPLNGRQVPVFDADEDPHRIAQHRKSRNSVLA